MPPQHEVSPGLERVRQNVGIGIVLTPEFKIRAEFSNTACSDLSGGPEATPVPTATVRSISAPQPLAQQAEVNRFHQVFVEAGVPRFGTVFVAAVAAHCHEDGAG